MSYLVLKSNAFKAQYASLPKHIQAVADSVVRRIAANPFCAGSTGNNSLRTLSADGVIIRYKIRTRMRVGLLELISCD